MLFFFAPSFLLRVGARRIALRYFLSAKAANRRCPHLTYIELPRLTYEQWLEQTRDRGKA